MYLTCEQRYNIAMKMLSIVEHMAFAKEKTETQLMAPTLVVDREVEETERMLNDMIKRDLNVGLTDLVGEQ